VGWKFRWRLWATPEIGRMMNTVVDTVREAGTDLAGIAIKVCPNGIKPGCRWGNQERLSSPAWRLRTTPL